MSKYYVSVYSKETDTFVKYLTHYEITINGIIHLGWGKIQPPIQLTKLEACLIAEYMSKSNKDFLYLVKEFPNV